MYLFHVNLRNAQDEFRNAQDELVQVNAERARVAFFNKMMMLLVSSMFLIRFMKLIQHKSYLTSIASSGVNPGSGTTGAGRVCEAGTVGEGSSIRSCNVIGSVLVTGISLAPNKSSSDLSYGQARTIYLAYSI
ncbi:hypothetical protein Tco_0011379 [Tanacetum coccineum]